MSMRSIQRTIAKERLKAMGVPHVNKVLGLGLSHTRHENMQKTYKGQQKLAKIRKEHIPLWRRVTVGSLAQDGYRAQMGIGKKRKYRIEQ